MKKIPEVKEGVSDVEVITLKRPIEIDGVELKTITLNFGDLTGEDMEGAEAEVKASGVDITTAHELHKTYLLAMASRASKINIADLRKLSIKDASMITLLVQGFLLN